MLRFLKPPDKNIKFRWCVGMGRCLNGTVLVSPVIEGALRYVQFLAESRNGLTLFIATNRLLFELERVFLGHSIISSFQDNAIL